MIQFFFLREKRHSPGQQENTELFSLGKLGMIQYLTHKANDVFFYQ